MAPISLDNVTVLSVDGIRMIVLEKGRHEIVNHRKNYGLLFCRDGQTVRTHAGTRVMAGSECAVLLPQGESCELACCADGSLPLVNFRTDRPICDTVTVLPLVGIDAYIRDCEKLRSLALFPGNRAKILSVFYDMLYRIEDHGRRRGNILAPAEMVIEAEYKNPVLSNAELAKACGISEVYFRKLFSEKHGVSPRQYIISVRVERAKQLLCEGNKKVCAVSEEAGFSNPYHFCRIFKERTGMTPTDYARRFSSHES